MLFSLIVRILKEDGGEARVNELGRVVCKLPMPPGTLSTLYKGWNQVKYEKDLDIEGKKCVLLIFHAE